MLIVPVLDLLRLVRSGCITDAIVVVKQIFETSGIDFGAVITFQGKQYTNSQVYFLLLAQQLIELVRLGNFPAAFKWGQDELVPFGNSHPDCNEIKAEVLGLLAYQKPLTSPVQHLLDKSRYAWLADLLNLCLLKTPDSPLDTVLRQVLALDGLVEEMGGFVEETDKKKWSALQALLSGTALTAKSSKTAISSPKLKLLKND